MGDDHNLSRMFEKQSIYLLELSPIENGNSAVIL